MEDSLNTIQEKIENGQFYKGDLGFDKNNKDKFIIYEILKDKKLEVCKIVIDEKNNILKIATKTIIINEEEFEIYTFALEKNTAEFILNLIFKMKLDAIKVNYSSDETDELGIPKKIKNSRGL